MAPPDVFIKTELLAHAGPTSKIPKETNNELVKNLQENPRDDIQKTLGITPEDKKRIEKEEKEEKQRKKNRKDNVKLLNLLTMSDNNEGMSPELREYMKTRKPTGSKEIEKWIIK